CWLSLLFLFFFSCRRRHTRFSRDWSSDVCSSDLRCTRRTDLRRARGRQGTQRRGLVCHRVLASAGRYHSRPRIAGGRERASRARSEERRVGKECRSQYPVHYLIEHDLEKAEYAAY